MPSDGTQLRNDGSANGQGKRHEPDKHYSATLVATTTLVQQQSWYNSKATMFASPNPPDFSYTLKPPNRHYRVHGKNPLFIIRQARGAKKPIPAKANKMVL